MLLQSETTVLPGGTSKGTVQVSGSLCIFGSKSNLRGLGLSGPKRRLRCLAEMYFWVYSALIMCLSFICVVGWMLEGMGW